MRDLIVELLGEYTPTLSPNGEVLGGLYSLDYTWLVGAFCFCATLVSVFCILRTLLKGVFK